MCVDLQVRALIMGFATCPKRLAISQPVCAITRFCNVFLPLERGVQTCRELLILVRQAYEYYASVGCER